MTRQLAKRVRKARRNGTCPQCHGPIRHGQQIAFILLGWVHVTCLIGSWTEVKQDDEAG